MGGGEDTGALPSDEGVGSRGQDGVSGPRADFGGVKMAMLRLEKLKGTASLGGKLPRVFMVRGVYGLGRFRGIGCAPVGFT